MSSRTIILEGPDGGGKTTLATMLRTAFGYQVVKTNAPRENEDLFLNYTDSLLRAIDDHRPVVFDRHWLGEGVYGPLLRGVDHLGDHGRDLIERLITARGVKVIICLPAWEANLAGWMAKDGNDLLKDPVQLAAVREKYVYEMERLREKGVDVHLYCFDDLRNTPEQVAIDLLRPSPAMPNGVTGYPGAEVLMVGEQVNTQAAAWDLPFHDLEASSLYIWDQVRSTGIGEDKVAWMNSKNYIGTVNYGLLTQTIDALPRVRTIVPLGQVAEEYARVELADIKTVEGLRPSITIHSMPHPQYWRRFQASRWGDYQRQLLEAMDV